jgi:hypothetical protein
MVLQLNKASYMNDIMKVIPTEATTHISHQYILRAVKKKLMKKKTNKIDIK